MLALRHGEQSPRHPPGWRSGPRALFQRIGFRRDEPLFETEAALAVEERVKRELALNGIVGGL